MDRQLLSTNVDLDTMPGDDSTSNVFVWLKFLGRMKLLTPKDVLERFPANVECRA